MYGLRSAAAAALLLASTGMTLAGTTVPLAPFKIADNLYYVGATDVTSYLIVTRNGLILLDGGFEQTAPQILANIKTLGFDPKNVKFLLNSHAHLDHAGEPVHRQHRRRRQRQEHRHRQRCQQIKQPERRARERSERRDPGRAFRHGMKAGSVSGAGSAR